MGQRVPPPSPTPGGRSKQAGIYSGCVGEGSVGTQGYTQNHGFQAGESRPQPQPPLLLLICARYPRLAVESKAEEETEREVEAKEKSSDRLSPPCRPRTRHPRGAPPACVHTSAWAPADPFSLLVAGVETWSPGFLHHVTSVKGDHFRSWGSPKHSPFLTSPPTLLFAPQKLQVAPRVP